MGRGGTTIGSKEMGLWWTRRGTGMRLNSKGNILWRSWGDIGEIIGGNGGYGRWEGARDGENE